jgi:hypothetical protein
VVEVYHTVSLTCVVQYMGGAISQRVHRSLEVLRRRLGPIHKANGQPDLFRHDGARYGNRCALEHALVLVGRVLDFGGWDLRWGVNTKPPLVLVYAHSRHRG